MGEIDGGKGLYDSAASSTNESNIKTLEKRIAVLEGRYEILKTTVQALLVYQHPDVELP